jgi:hypothetical protein
MRKQRARVRELGFQATRGSRAGRAWSQMRITRISSVSYSFESSGATVAISAIADSADSITGRFPGSTSSIKLYFLRGDLDCRKDCASWRVISSIPSVPDYQGHIYTYQCGGLGQERTNRIRKMRPELSTQDAARPRRKGGQERKTKC